MTALLWASLALAGELHDLRGEEVVLTNPEGLTAQGTLLEVGDDQLSLDMDGQIFDIPLEEVVSAELYAPEETRVRLEDLRGTEDYAQGFSDGALDGSQLSVQQPALAGAACGMASGAGCCFVGPVCALPVMVAPTWYYSIQEYEFDSTDPYELGYYEGMADAWRERSTQASAGGAAIGGVVGFGLLVGGWATWMAWQGGVF